MDEKKPLTDDIYSNIKNMDLKADATTDSDDSLKIKETYQNVCDFYFDEDEIKKSDPSLSMTCIIYGCLIVASLVIVILLWV